MCLCKKNTFWCLIVARLFGVIWFCKIMYKIRFKHVHILPFCHLNCKLMYFMLYRGLLCVSSLSKNEVTLLRNEVAQLKQLLLAHKDCPVTAMQKKSGYHSE